MKQPTYVYLYSEPAAASLDLPQICNYVKNTLPPLEVVVRENFTRSNLGAPTGKALSSLAEELARAKVRNPLRQVGDFTPLRGEVDYEERRLSDPDKKSWGILYDGYKLMRILQRMISQAEGNLSHIHVVFTNQLFGTWDENDQRYHARVSVYGFPSLISTTGIVEAPAKPREYYLLKQQYAALGMPDATAIELDTQFRGQFISHGDPRLTEVMKGYALQAILYHLWGDPFCQDKSCRLYNAHWQLEVIGAQLEGEYEFCPFHRDKLQQLEEELK
jgi:hypothetical protein